MGNLKFVVGFETGLDQAWSMGRPAMLFFTSAKDEWCPLFGQRTWKDAEVEKRVDRYLPVLVDAVAEKEVVKRYEVLVLPAVVWVDYDGNSLFMSQGDADLELFREAASVAQARAPQVKVPADVEILARVRADLAKHGAAGNVRKALDAATALKAMKRPRAAREEGEKASADLLAKGQARLDAARKDAQDGKADEARAAFTSLASDYRGYDLGRQAAAALEAMGPATGG
jgi:hypothetical protein